MSDKIFDILISHDNSDEEIAGQLKEFLEKIFYNEDFFVSGRDLEGGQTWIEQIKIALKSSKVIITIITENSLKSNWVFFESGVGFTEDRTIPLLADKLQMSSLAPPLNFLHARTLSKKGIEELVRDIASKLSSKRVPEIIGLENFIKNYEASLLEKKISELFRIMPKARVAPLSEKQWPYQKNCIVHDYTIGGRSLSIDTYLYPDYSEIQIFTRNTNDNEFIISNFYNEDFLSNSLDNCPIEHERIIYRRLKGWDISKIRGSLSELLKKVELYKVNKEKPPVVLFDSTLKEDLGTPTQANSAPIHKEVQTNESIPFITEKEYEDGEAIPFYKYVGLPNTDGIFGLNSFKSDPVSDSVYEVEMYDDVPDKAFFSLLPNPEVIHKALLEPFVYLAPCCSYNDNPNGKHTIVLVEEGMLRKMDGQWMIYEKAKIKFE